MIKSFTMLLARSSGAANAPLSQPVKTGPSLPDGFDVTDPRGSDKALLDRIHATRLARIARFRENMAAKGESPETIERIAKAFTTYAQSGLESHKATSEMYWGNVETIAAIDDPGLRATGLDALHRC